MCLSVFLYVFVFFCLASTVWKGIVFLTKPIQLLNDPKLTILAATATTALVMVVLFHETQQNAQSDII